MYYLECSYYCGRVPRNCACLDPPTFETHRHEKLDFDKSRLSCLDLETARSTTTTSTLEFASLGAHIRLDSVVGVWVVDGSSVSKVSECLTGFRSSEKDGIGSLWSTEG